MKTVAHTILSPYAVYLHLYIHVQVWVHIPGAPQECSAEERYNTNIGRSIRGVMNIARATRGPSDKKQKALKTRGVRGHAPPPNFLKTYN